MKRFQYILSGLVFLSLLTSCFKEDTPVLPYVSPEGVVVAVAEMKPDYSMQVYYDLETNTFVKSNHREDWDIAFSCDAGVNAVYGNLAKQLRVYNTGSTDWTVSPGNLNSLAYTYDAPTGEPEKTALKNRVYGNVYVVDLGKSTAGTSLGHKKLKFLSSDEQEISFEFANIDGSNITAGKLTKNADYNFVYYSFKNGGEVVTPEPKKNAYDLVFSYYSKEIYYSATEFLWYGVTGVLLNPNGVAVATDSTDNFTGITYQDLDNYTFSQVRDVIGYEWKSYNIDEGVYTILTKNTYMIRDRSGNFWKLRFTSFTNVQGERGNPTFEVARF